MPERDEWRMGERSSTTAERIAALEAKFGMVLERLDELTSDVREVKEKLSGASGAVRLVVALVGISGALLALAHFLGLRSN